MTDLCPPPKLPFLAFPFFMKPYLVASELTHWAQFLDSLGLLIGIMEVQKQHNDSELLQVQNFWKISNLCGKHYWHLPIPQHIPWVSKKIQKWYFCKLQKFCRYLYLQKFRTNNASYTMNIIHISGVGHGHQIRHQACPIAHVFECLPVFKNSNPMPILLVPTIMTKT